MTDRAPNTPANEASDTRAAASLSVGDASPPPNPKTVIRHAILHDSVLPTMLRLALPMIVVMVVQTAVGIAETIYIGLLGTDSLAGVALVFPVLMLMTMMSSGGIGGGVSGSVARAIGAGRQADADALVLHALVLAVGFGLTFTVGALAAGPRLYRALGGDGATLDAALTYSEFTFAGAIPIWIVNLLTAALRGAGNVRIPALVILVGAAVVIPLSPALIFGIGPLPRFGIGGAGAALTLYYVGAAAVLLRYMASGRGGLSLRLGSLRASLFRNILGVGLLSAFATAQLNLTVVLVTGAVGLFGADAVAGYGLASRLDYLLIPLLFGLGTAVVTMVGTSAGAGAHARARRIAWTGALLAAAVTEAVGLTVAAAPNIWLGLFSREPAVLAIGALYLQRIGPAYGAVGFGILCSFAAQGFGRVLPQTLAGTIRSLVAAGIGWLVVARFDAGPATLFTIIALSSVLFGGMNLVIAVGAGKER